MRSIFALIALVSAAHAATMTQAYSFSTFGIAGTAPGVGCTTFGPTSIMRASSLNLGIAQGGTGCGQLEDLKNVLGTGNLVTATTSASGAAVGANGAFSGSGSAFSKAATNVLGVDAEFSILGVPDSQTVRGAESLAVFSEDLATTTGALVNGKLRYTLGLTGSQSFATTAPGQPTTGDGFLYLAYRNLAESFFYPIFFASTGFSGGTYTQIFGTYQYTTGDGVTIGTSSVSVNRNFVLEVPFNTTSPYDGAFYLYAGAYGGANSDIDILYSSTLNILSVEAFTSNGTPVDLVRGSAQSNVPEPNTAILLGLLSIASCFTIKRRGNPRNHPPR